MLGDTSIPIEVRADWVWAQVASLHPEFKREYFQGRDDDPYLVYDLVVDNVCNYAPKPGHRVMDVGANRGVFTVLCALNGAHVTAYEPLTEALVMLRDTVKRAGVTHLVDARSEVIWTTTGTVPFYGSKFLPWLGAPFDSCNGAVRYGAEAVGRPSVPCVSLVEAIGGNEWDCVKMDVEGAEFPVLMSTPEDTLRKVKYLTVELHNLHVDKAGHDALVDRLQRVFILNGRKDGAPSFRDEGRWISIYATRKDEVA